MIHVLRLENGNDLKQSILKFCINNNIKVVIILSSVGSLNKLNIRLVQADNCLIKNDYFEIIVLNGTIS
jgi:predicted DNA-binding protein with PD1-like motif